jgi:hypothetical protein
MMFHYKYIPVLHLISSSISHKYSYIMPNAKKPRNKPGMKNGVNLTFLFQILENDDISLVFPFYKCHSSTVYLGINLCI